MSREIKSRVSKGETKMKTIEESRDYLLENYVDEDGNLVLSDLDFSDFEGDVYISSMKVKGSLHQSGHEVQGSLDQSGHEVQGYLSQSHQEAEGNLYNVNNRYGRNLYETPSTKLLKEITAEELAELGYTLKGINNDKH